MSPRSSPVALSRGSNCPANLQTTDGAPTLDPNELLASSLSLGTASATVPSCTIKRRDRSTLLFSFVQSQRVFRTRYMYVTVAAQSLYTILRL